MKIKELIALLQKEDLDANVYYMDYSTGIACGVTGLKRAKEYAGIGSQPAEYKEILLLKSD